MRWYWLASVLWGGSLLFLQGGFCAEVEEAFLDAEQTAIEAAVQRVAPAIVRIELIGIAETTAEVRADAPTVGTIIDPDGWIVASAQVAAQPAATILVVTQTAERLTAAIVAQDRAREWVLLKVDSPEPLPAVSLLADIPTQIGQYTIAVGRVADGGKPAVSVGILSAVDRLHGRALQTDARVSPLFYGGPLLNIQGDVLGFLVPAMPDAAGAEEKSGWYDSGIAFAVPTDQVLRRVPRMQQGTDIHPGLLGIAAGEADPYSPVAKIAGVRVRSPAEKAGLQPNDRWLEIEDQPISFQYQLKQILGQFDAGDEIRMRIERDDQELELSATLAQTIPPLDLQSIGIYVRGDAETLRIVGIQPDSPAAVGGLELGDQLITLQELPIVSRRALRQQIALADPEEKLRWKVRRGDREIDLETTVVSIAGNLRALPDDDQMFPTIPAGQWQTAQLALPDVANQIRYYAPETDGDAPLAGLLVVLLDPGDTELEKALESWRSAAEKFSVAVAVIASADEKRWTPAEADVVSRAAAQLANRLQLDRSGCGLTGQSAAASFAMALVVAITETEAFSGIAVVTELRPPAVRLKENDVDLPLQFALPVTEDDDLPSWAGVLPRLGYPIIRTGQRDPQTLLRWVRTLSRL